MREWTRDEVTKVLVSLHHHLWFSGACGVWGVGGWEALLQIQEPRAWVELPQQ